MTSNILSLAEAMSIDGRQPISDEFDDCLDLSFYTQADLNAFEYLANEGDRQSVLLGLNHLDEQVASVITSFCHNIIFENLPHLSREAAAVLSNSINVLEIKGLRDIDPAVAAELSKHKTSLYLSILVPLTSELVSKLVKHNHELFLTVAIEPEISLQKEFLSSYAGHEATIRFPVNSETCGEEYFKNSHKKMEVRTFKDDSGQLWRDITGNDVDGWFKRNAINQ